MTHDWGYAGGRCIWCGAIKLELQLELQEEGECPKHPRSNKPPRPFPGSAVEDFDGIRARCAELRVEACAAVAGGAE